MKRLKCEASQVHIHSGGRHNPDRSSFLFFFDFLPPAGCLVNSLALVS